MRLTIGISDAKVSIRREDVLVTHALGSCIGVALFDPIAEIGGLLHFQLPSSLMDPARAAQRPLMYADTGMEALFALMTERGAQKSRMKVWLAGGAQILEDQALFNIGRRNQVAIRKVLWVHGLLIGREKLGGSSPVTMELCLGTGEVSLKGCSQSKAA